MEPYWLAIVVFLWWFIDVIRSVLIDGWIFQQARAVNWNLAIKYSWFIELTTFQLLVGGVTTALWLKFVLKKELYPGKTSNKTFTAVVFGNLVGNIAANGASFAHTLRMEQNIRSWEPIITFLFLQAFISRRKFNQGAFILMSVVFISTGSFIFTYCKHSSTFWGILTGVATTVAFSFRNIYLKNFRDSRQNPIQKYSAVSLWGALLLMPVVLLKLNFTSVKFFIQPKLVLQYTVFQFANNFASFCILENVSPLFYAILTVTKQVSVTTAAHFYLKMALPWYRVAGLAAFFIGLIVFYTAMRGYSSKTISLFVSLNALCLCCFAFIFGDQMAITGLPIERNSSPSLDLILPPISTSWIYERPMPKDVQLNFRILQAKTGRRVHVFCGAFNCLDSIKRLDNTKITASFLVIRDIVLSTPLEHWLSRHPLYKVVSGKYYEDYLHQAVQLAIFTKYGGIYVDPFHRIHETAVFRYPSSWVSANSADAYPGIFDVCNFLPGHQFLHSLSNLFVSEYSKKVDGRTARASQEFDFAKIARKDLERFCKHNDTGSHCPKIMVIKSSKLVINAIKEKQPLAGAFQNRDIDFDVFGELQFVPQLESFRRNINTSKETRADLFQTAKKNIANSLSHDESVKKKVSSVRGDSRIKCQLEHIEYLRMTTPVGCLDRTSVQILQSLGVPAYFSAGTSILLINPNSGSDRTNNIYLFDVHSNVKKLLPSELVKKAITIERSIKDEVQISDLMKIKVFYDIIEKFSLANLVITQSIHCALACVAMDTPVVYIKSSQFGDEFSGLFPIIELAKNSDDNGNVLSDFNWSHVSSNPNPNLFMRLRATTWNTIRKQKRLHEAALKFGLIPLLSPSYDQRSRHLFHLIFTTSSRDSVHVSLSKGEVKGTFTWRHRRCIEAIFHHYPFARVIIHSHTLPQSLFDVFKEAGYDLQVKPYTLADLVKGTPAENFVSEEVPYAREGRYWYSHETDLIRLLVLYKWGGIYIDTDIITVRRFDDLPENVLGLEDEAILNGAVMMFKKDHPFLRRCIEKYAGSYDGTSWGANGPHLLTKVWREFRVGNRADDIKILRRTAFYMFHYDDVVQDCFHSTAGKKFQSQMKVLKEEAYMVHLNSKVSAKEGVGRERMKEGTICKYLLNKFCVLCDEVY